MGAKRATKNSIKIGRPALRVGPFKLVQFRLSEETYERLEKVIAIQAYKHDTTTKMAPYLEEIVIKPHIEEVEAKMKKAVPV